MPSTGIADPSCVGYYTLSIPALLFHFSQRPHAPYLSAVLCLLETRRKREQGKVHLSTRKYLHSSFIAFEWNMLPVYTTESGVIIERFRTLLNFCTSKTGPIKSWDIKHMSVLFYTDLFEQTWIPSYPCLVPLSTEATHGFQINNILLSSLSLRYKRCAIRCSLHYSSSPLGHSRISNVSPEASCFLKVMRLGKTFLRLCLHERFFDTTYNTVDVASRFVDD